MEVTLASFHGEGKCPACIDRLKIMEYGSARTEDPSLGSRRFMRSGPQALLTSRLSKTFLTSCTVKGIDSRCSWDEVVFGGRGL